MKENNKNSISTAAVQYATVESLNTEARTRANADSQIRTTIQVLSDDYEDFKENGGGSGGVSKDYVDTQDALKQNITDNTLTTTNKTIVGAINENVTSIGTKQDTLVDSGDNQNIKTINSQSILGTGDITIEGGSGSTNLDNNIEIYDNEDNNFVQYKATNLDWTAASDDSLTSKSYVDQQDTTITNSISTKADTAYVDTQDALKQNITDNTLTTTNKTIVGGINELVTNKQNTLVDSGDNQNIKTINSQSILGTGDITIEGGSTDLDNNIEIYDNEDNNFVQYKTTDLDWTAASDETLTSKSYVDQQDTTITNSISTKADTTYVDTQDALKQNITDNTLTTTNKTIVGGINELVTSKQNTLVDSGSNQNIKTINNQSILGTGDITIEGGSTDLDNNIEIYDNEDNNFVQYKTTDLDWTAASDETLTSKSYVDQQDTTITNSISTKADTTYVDTQDALKQNITDNTLTTTNKTIVGGINELVTNKQNTLVDSGSNQNIKTINNQSILGTGDITIEGGSTDLDNNIEIYDNEDNNFVQYKTTDLDWTAASDETLTSKSYVDQQDTTITNSISTKADTTYVDTQDALKQNITDNTLTTTNKTIIGAINENVTSINTKQNINDSTLTTTTKTIVGGINELVTNKQDTLVDTGDTQNIKTINSQSILGTGDITIEGGSTDLDNNIEIYDNENNNFVQYKTTDLDWTAASDETLTSKSYVDQQDTTITNSISTKADTTYVDTQDALKQNITDNTLTTTNKTIVGAINENVTSINTKQNINDSTLTTTTKTIVGGINELVTNKQNTLVDSGNNQNIKTINGTSLLGTGDIEISVDGSSPLEDNIEIYDNEDNNFVQYKATNLDWTAASDETLTSKSYVDQQDTTITNSISTKADTTYVDTQDALKQNITDNTLTTTNKTIVGGINELVTNKQNTLVDSGSNQNIKTINSTSLLGTGDIEISVDGSSPLEDNIEIYDNEDNNFVQYKATNLDWTNASDETLTSKSYVDQQDTTITNSISTKADTTYVDTQDALKQNITDNTLTTTNKTIIGAINENVTTIGTKQNINDSTLTTTTKTIVGGINELVTSKQNTLVDSGDNQNIKTINGTSLLGTGDIEISVDGSSPLEDNIEIYDNEDNNFVQYKATNLDWTAASDNSLTSKSYVDQQDTIITNSISTKADTAYVDSQDALKQNITDNTLTTTNKTIIGAINENVTTIGTKQDTLVDSGSNQNIKTINSQSILGTGDITIEGGSTDLDNNIEIYDNENNNFVQYKATDLDWTAASDETLTSKSYVDQQDTTITNSISTKADTTYVDSQDALKQNITDNTLTTTNKTIIGAINENVTTIGTKQNINDSTLTTTTKTIVGGINELVTSKQNTLVDNGSSQNIKTINSQSILGTGDITIEGGSTDLDNNIEIYDNEDNNFVQYKTTDLDWTAASDDSLTSKSYVDQQDTTITNSISTKADTTYVDTQDALKQNITDNTLTTTSQTIVGAINEVNTNIGTKVNALNNQVNFDASSIDATTVGIFVKALTKRGTSAYLTFDQINAKQDQTDTTLTTTDQTVVGAINELVTNKQDILVDTGDTQNIKTINGTSLLGTGDIEISVDGSSPLEDNIEIYDNEDNNFVQYKTTNLDWTAASDETLTSKSYVDQQDTTITNSISTKADTTYVDSQDALKQNITDNTLNTDDKTVVGAINELSGTKTSFTYVDSQISTKQNQNDSTLNTTSKTIVGAINENLTSIGTKQDTLTDSGDNQNIKTINSQSILGTGDITIEGGSGSTDLDNNIEIYDNEDNNFVQYKVTNPDWTAASDETLTSKSYVDTQDALKQNQTDTNLTTTSQTIVGAINEVNTNTNTKINAFSGSLTLDPSAFYKNNGNQISVLAIGKTGLANDQHFTWDKINAKQDQTDTTLTTTDQTVVGAINELVTNKQDTLVDSGDTQNIKTINSQSLLGSGDLIISAYIPGEYKYMPLSVTTMPDGWVKYNHVANRPILLSHFLSDFPTAVSNPSFDIGTNNDYQISWIPTSTLGALNFTDNTSDPATSYGFALVKSQLWQYDPDGSFSAERAEEEKLLLNEFKNKNINI